MNFQTPDFSTPDMGFKRGVLRILGLKSSLLKSLGLKSPGLESSWLKSPGLKGLGLKLGVEKSGVEMSFNQSSLGFISQIKGLLCQTQLAF
jgi:hypothetical protein